MTNVREVIYGRATGIESNEGLIKGSEFFD